MAVSPPLLPGANTSQALLRLSAARANGSSVTTNTSYVRAVVSLDGATLIRVEQLGTDGRFCTGECTGDDG